MRDLERIWSTPGRVGYGFDGRNTIMIDDSQRKVT